MRGRNSAQTRRSTGAGMRAVGDMSERPLPTKKGGYGKLATPGSTTSRSGKGFNMRARSDSCVSIDVSKGTAGHMKTISRAEKHIPAAYKMAFAPVDEGAALDGTTSSGGVLSYHDLSSHLRSLRTEYIRRIARPLVQRMMNHQKNMNIFNTPVDLEAIPAYLQKVKYPMDLGTIRSHLHNGSYSSIDACFDDMRRVFDNAILFNPSSHLIHKLAVELKVELENEIAIAEERCLREVERKTAHSCSMCSGTSCMLCGEKCLKFELPVLVCHGACMQRIKKNSVYYVKADGSMIWCQKCYISLPSVLPDERDTPTHNEPTNGSGHAAPTPGPICSGMPSLREPAALGGVEEEEVSPHDFANIPGGSGVGGGGAVCSKTLNLKRNLLKRRLDEEVSEPWVECDDCGEWMHQTCALYNDNSPPPAPTWSLEATGVEEAADSGVDDAHSGSGSGKETKSRGKRAMSEQDVRKRSNSVLTHSSSTMASAGAASSGEASRRRRIRSKSEMPLTRAPKSLLSSSHTAAGTKGLFIETTCDEDILSELGSDAGVDLDIADADISGELDTDETENPEAQHSFRCPLCKLKKFDRANPQYHVLIPEIPVAPAAVTFPTGIAALGTEVDANLPSRKTETVLEASSVPFADDVKVEMWAARSLEQQLHSRTTSPVTPREGQIRIKIEGHETTKKEDDIAILDVTGGQVETCEMRSSARVESAEEAPVQPSQQEEPSTEDLDGAVTPPALASPSNVAERPSCAQRSDNIGSVGSSCPDVLLTELIMRQTDATEDVVGTSLTGIEVAASSVHTPSPIDQRKTDASIIPPLGVDSVLNVSESTFCLSTPSVPAIVAEEHKLSPPSAPSASTLGGVAARTSSPRAAIAADSSAFFCQSAQSAPSQQPTVPPPVLAMSRDESLLSITENRAEANKPSMAGLSLSLKDSPVTQEVVGDLTVATIEPRTVTTEHLTFANPTPDETPAVTLQIEHTIETASIPTDANVVNPASHVHSQWTAASLPRTQLSDLLEKMVQERLKELAAAQKERRATTERAVAEARETKKEALKNSYGTRKASVRGERGDAAVAESCLAVAATAPSMAGTQPSEVCPEVLVDPQSVTIRMTANFDRKYEVPQVVVDNTRTAAGHDVPQQLACRQKCIMLFQKIDGVDVMLFCLYVQEFDSSCPAPNTNTVYIAYLDSVDYFRPMEARTAVYQEILVGYLAWAHARGFKHCHIWSCPPQRGDNFIFWCHPPHQRTPSRERLNSWYNSVLVRASMLCILDDVKSLWDAYFSEYGQRHDGGNGYTARAAAKNSFVGSGMVSADGLKRKNNVLGTKNLKKSVDEEKECISTPGGSIDQSSMTAMSIPLCPPIFEGDFWLLEYNRLSRHAVQNVREDGGEDAMHNSRVCKDILKALMGRANAPAFNQPVDYVSLEIPTYPEIIKNPMDLGTVRTKLHAGEYLTVREWVDDVRLTFSNAMTFNPPGNSVHQHAHTLNQDFNVTVLEFVRTCVGAANGSEFINAREAETYLSRYPLGVTLGPLSTRGVGAGFEQSCRSSTSAVSAAAAADVAERGESKSAITDTKIKMSTAAKLKASPSAARLSSADLSLLTEVDADWNTADQQDAGSQLLQVMKSPPPAPVTEEDFLSLVVVAPNAPLRLDDTEDAPIVSAGKDLAVVVPAEASSPIEPSSGGEEMPGPKRKSMQASIVDFLQAKYLRGSSAGSENSDNSYSCHPLAANSRVSVISPRPHPPTGVCTNSASVNIGSILPCPRLYSSMSSDDAEIAAARAVDVPDSGAIEVSTSPRPGDNPTSLGIGAQESANDIAAGQATSTGTGNAEDNSELELDHKRTRSGSLSLSHPHSLAKPLSTDSVGSAGTGRVQDAHTPLTIFTPGSTGGGNSHPMYFSARVFNQTSSAALLARWEQKKQQQEQLQRWWPQPPGLGFRGARQLMSDLSKLVLRMNDDLFVIDFGPKLKSRKASLDLTAAPGNTSADYVRGKSHKGKAAAFLKKHRAAIAGMKAGGAGSASSTCAASGGSSSNEAVVKDGADSCHGVEAKRASEAVKAVSKADAEEEEEEEENKGGAGTPLPVLSDAVIAILNEVRPNTSDPDPVIFSPLANDRHTFQEICQFHHFQFDSLRRAKHSSLMLLRFLHNPRDEKLTPRCTRCGTILANIRWHCDQCPNFDICSSCNELNNELLAAYNRKKRVMSGAAKAGSAVGGGMLNCASNDSLNSIHSGEATPASGNDAPVRRRRGRLPKALAAQHQSQLWQPEDTVDLTPPRCSKECGGAHPHPLSPFRVTYEPLPPQLD